MKSWGGILWTVPHEYQVKKNNNLHKVLGQSWIKKKIKKLTKKLKKNIKKKCLDNRGPWPMSKSKKKKKKKKKNAWTIVDRGP